jgi:hypothetical protein
MRADLLGRSFIPRPAAVKADVPSRIIGRSPSDQCDFTPAHDGRADLGKASIMAFIPARGVIRGGPYSARRTSSLSLIPRAAANELATSIPTFTLPNSTELIYVRCTLARSAKSSWESLSFSRAKRIALPKVSRENLVAFATPYF